MSAYVPLYRKYRPQSFADLVGQESVVKTLSNAVNLGRISHAYLFTGPRGTGKTSSARILAKSLNCVNGPTVSPCGVCPSCIDITASNSIDVIEIDAASNRKVEDARNLLEKVHFVPVSGKYKIYIIDEVHMLTTEAFNTLLKTLEEPPKNLVFILATTEAHKVLNTIISRCQKFDFKRVPHDLIVKRLREIATQESIEINDKALSLIAKKSYGGMRDALSLLDQASVLTNKGIEITENDILLLFGSLSEDTLFELAQNIAQRDTINLLSTANKAVESCEPANVIRELVSYFRNMLILKTSVEIEKVKDLIDLSDNIIPNVKMQSEHFETDEVIQIIEKLCEYERTIKTTQQQQLWLEVSLLSICHRQDMKILKDMLQRIERLEQGAAPVAAPQYKPAPPPSMPAPLPKQPVVEPAPVKTEAPMPAVKKEEEQLEPAPVQPVFSNQASSNPSNLSDSWSVLLSKITKMPSRTFFMTLGKPVLISAEKIEISFVNETFVNGAKEDNKYKPLEEAAQAMFSTLPKIIIRTPLPDDSKIEKKNDEIKPPVPKIEEPKPKPVAQIAIDVENHEPIEQEVTQELENLHKSVMPVNISDQAKMVMEIFSGKIVD